MDLTPDGLDRLLDALSDLGAGDHDPLESHRLAAQNVTAVLGGAREQGWPFDKAWSSAINRIQPSQRAVPLAGRRFGEAWLRTPYGTETADGRLEALEAYGQVDLDMRETRALIEEDRPVYQALYERRDPTPRENAERTAAAWARCFA